MAAALWAQELIPRVTLTGFQSQVYRQTCNSYAGFLCNELISIAIILHRLILRNIGWPCWQWPALRDEGFEIKCQCGYWWYYNWHAGPHCCSVLVLEGSAGTSQHSSTDQTDTLALLSPLTTPLTDSLTSRDPPAPCPRPCPAPWPGPWPAPRWQSAGVGRLDVKIGLPAILCSAGAGCLARDPTPPLTLSLQPPLHPQHGTQLIKTMSVKWSFSRLNLFFFSFQNCVNPVGCEPIVFCC